MTRLLGAAGLAVASGALYALAFPPAGGWPLAWVCIVPVALVARTRPIGEAVAAGSVFGATATVWVAGFVADGLEARWGLDPGAARVTMGIVAGAYGVAWGGGAFALAGLFRRVVRLGPVASLALAWLLVDVWRSSSWGGVPWAQLGSSQSPVPVLLQLAELGGAPAVGIPVLLVNGCLVEAIVAVRTDRHHRVYRGALRWAAGAAAALAATAAYGAARLAHVDAVQDTAPRLTVALAQGNWKTPGRGERGGERGGAARHRLHALTRLAFAHGAEVAVWGEGVAGRFDPGRDWARPIGLDGDRALLAGVAEERASAAGSTETRNAAAWIRAGAAPALYAKRELLPLVERPYGAPGRWLVERLVTRPPRYVTAGREPPPVFEGPDWSVAPLICFELLYGARLRASARTGADWLANISNDRWYDGTPGGAQHHAQAPLAAASVRRPLVRVSNTGISGAFDAGGRPLPLRILRLAGAAAPHSTRGVEIPAGVAAVGLVDVALAAPDPPLGPVGPGWLIPTLGLAGWWTGRRRSRESSAG